MSMKVSGCALKLFSTFGCVCYITSSVLRWSSWSKGRRFGSGNREIGKYLNKIKELFLVLRNVDKGHGCTLGHYQPDSTRIKGARKDYLNRRPGASL